MSDNIPFEIQTEIIKNVSDVKSLIQFRSVSKQWKSFIDTSEFIKGYGARHTQPRSHILSYKSDYSMDDEANYIYVVDDDIKTFKVLKQELTPFAMSPLLKKYRRSFVIGACHGLLCWNGISKVYNKEMVVIWNPSIRKSIGIVVRKYRYSLRVRYQRVYGFGVCPGTSDPTVIKVIRAHPAHWHVEVFTLSSGVWNVIPTGNLPRQSIELSKSTPVVIDRFIYWDATEKNFTTDINMLVSFDLITKEFKVVDLPDSLKTGFLFVSKLRESLIVSKFIFVVGKGAHCGLWVMDHDSSFKRLFTIGAQVQIVGFKENGETIIRGLDPKLDVYDPRSQQIKNLGISRELEGSFFMGTYKESLLLLDQPDLHIYSEDR